MPGSHRHGFSAGTLSGNNLKTSRGVDIIPPSPPPPRQAKRCSKAVRENISKAKLQQQGYVDIKILNVFKLEHAFLSKKLQRANERAVGNVKIKGLFVPLPKNGLYGFCAYGLYAQGIGPNPSPATLPGIFHLPWFCTELSGSSEPIRASSVDARGGVADGPSAGSGARGKGPTKPGPGKPRGTAESLARANLDLFLRFSKYSNPVVAAPPSPAAAAAAAGQQRQPTPTAPTTSETDDGTFISLCRVLVRNQRTVDGAITERHIQLAQADGVDALYSRANDEYVLLRPEHVLPEFIMHVRLLGKGPDVGGEDVGGVARRAAGGPAGTEEGPGPGGTPLARLRSRSQSPQVATRPAARRVALPPPLTVPAPHDEYATAAGDDFNDRTTPPGAAAFADGPSVGAIFMQNELTAAATDAADPSTVKPQLSLRSQIAHLESLSAALRQKQEIVKRIEKATTEFSHQRAQALGNACEWFLGLRNQQGGGARVAAEGRVVSR